MSTAMVVLLIVAGAVALLVLLVVVVGLAARKVTRSAAADPAVQGALQVQPAVLRGAHNAGIRLMGNGVLALHPDRLVFVLGAPNRVLDIPLAAISDVEVTAQLRMPGKVSAGRRLHLVVRAATPDGEAILGWIVAEPARWAEAIRPGRWRDAAGTNG